MYSSMQQGDTKTPYLQSYVADARADIDDLPTDIPVGSTCLVIADSSVFMLGNDKHWHELE